MRESTWRQIFLQLDLWSSIVTLAVMLLQPSEALLFRKILNKRCNWVLIYIPLNLNMLKLTILSILLHLERIDKPYYAFWWYVRPKVSWASGWCSSHKDTPHSKDTGDISMGEFPIHFWKVTWTFWFMFTFLNYYHNWCVFVNYKAFIQRSFIKLHDNISKSNQHIQIGPVKSS